MLVGWDNKDLDLHHQEIPVSLCFYIKCCKFYIYVICQHNSEVFTPHGKRHSPGNVVRIMEEKNGKKTPSTLWGVTFMLVLRISLLFQTIWWDKIWLSKHTYINGHLIFFFFLLYDLTWKKLWVSPKDCNSRTVNTKLRLRHFDPSLSYSTAGRPGHQMILKSTRHTFQGASPYCSSVYPLWTATGLFH